MNASGQPQLANPIAINTELDAANLLPAGQMAFCQEAVGAELGTRVVAGTTYGADATELVIACSVGASTAGATFDTQIWVRYANPSGGAPYYELLRDLGEDLELRIRTGDINGDGLDDVLYTYGTFGIGVQDVHALLQCDTHQAGCKAGE